MDMSSTINRHFQQTKGQFYQNSGYCDSRTDKQILILDVTLDTSPTTFDGSTSPKGLLHEPLKIDTLSDVYLDNFTTYCALKNNKSGNKNIAFVLSIDQFSTKSISNLHQYYNKIVIPNEETATGSDALKVHKGRKMNYICSINPQTITKLSGSITDTNATGTATAGAANFRFIAEFIIVARN
jgi:hypothetical protein